MSETCPFKLDITTIPVYIYSGDTLITGHRKTNPKQIS